MVENERFADTKFFCKKAYYYAYLKTCGTMACMKLEHSKSGMGMEGSDKLSLRGAKGARTISVKEK